VIHALLLAGALTARAGDDVAAAEAAADARITACRALPASCVGEERELARAFLVKVTAASVLRGEIVRVSAANARLLDRGVVEDWSSLLDADESVQPDPWVVALAAAAWAARADPAKLEPAVPAAAWPPTLRQTVVELTGGLVPSAGISWERTRYAGNLEVRLGFDRNLGLRLDGWLDAVRGPYLTGGLAAGGGRWKPLRRGGEQLLTAGLSFVGHGASRRADRLHFVDTGYWAPPPELGFGVQVRELARVSLEPGGRAFFTVDFLADVTKWISLRQPTWHHEGYGAESVPYTDTCSRPDCLAPDLAGLKLALGLEWRPVPTVRIGFDGRFDVDVPFTRTRRPPMRGFFEVHVGWSTARKAPTQARDADRDVDAFLDGR
jgi:hypothetical protein